MPVVGHSPRSSPGIVFSVSDRRTYALIAAVAVAAHATTLLGGFAWLDHAHLLGKAALAAGDWGRLFTQGFGGTGFYRPLMGVSLSVDDTLGGAAWLYHATSLGWHASAAVMVAVAAQALGLSPPRAAVAGILFAVHPATSLVAGAIAFRSEAIITVSLLALVVFHRRGRPVAAALALLAGALTKETALVLGPLFVVALELEGKLAGRSVRRPLVAAEGVALAVALGLRAAFAPAWRASFPPLAVGEALGTRLAALFKTALLAVAPLDRSLCDAFPVTSLVGPRALGGALVLLGVVALALAWKRRGPAMLLALALLPGLQLAPVMRWWSPHYLYVPLAFAVMLIAETPVPRRLLMGLALVLAIITLRDDLRFRSDETLWASEGPACREGQFYLGEAARQRGRLQEAASHYERAVATTAGVLSYVDRAAALQNLGVTRLAQGDLADAAVAFRAALGVVSDEPRRREITHNLATAELRAGDPTEAARLLEPETARPDALPESLFVRAQALRLLGRPGEADALMRRLGR